ncbi:MAG: hypothetical protein ACEQSK_15720 [Sphingomonadaceae bacterium]
MQVHTPFRRNLFKAAIALALCAGPLAHAAPDPALRPGDDFFGYVNGDWLKTVQIPADRSRWGIAGELAELNNQRLLKLIEEAGRNASAEARMVADFYHTSFDEAAIEAQGLAPLQKVLAPLAAIQDKAQLTRALGASLRADVDPLNATNFNTENLFGLWIAQGLTDPAHNTAYLLQGGLGMPDRAYYLDDKPAMQTLRDKYQAHIAAVFRLAGLDQAEARAARVLALETKIARSHASREDSADIQKANNNWKASDFASKAPGMDWKLFLQSAGLGQQQKFIAYHPGALRGAAALVGSEPLEAWKDFLAFHTINHLSTALPKALADQHFESEPENRTGT